MIKQYRLRAPVQAFHFTGEMDEALERWLGAEFSSWVPSKRMLEICWRGSSPRTTTYCVQPGQTLYRLYPGELVLVMDTDVFEHYYEPAP